MTGATGAAGGCTCTQLAGIDTMLPVTATITPLLNNSTSLRAAAEFGQASVPMEADGTTRLLFALTPKVIVMVVGVVHAHVDVSPRLLFSTRP